VRAPSSSIVLDRDQLRDITLDDEDLMREILAALIDDTSQQLQQLESAIRNQDSMLCMRLAHYSKGACANVGANAAASLFESIEARAKDRDFNDCGASLVNLNYQLDRLRSEASLF
jgi:HPt (histidine-containing phosphotransfer) domain-containing protein